MPPPFLDTNILVYLTSKDPTIVAITDRLVRSRNIISVQVLNEVVNVLRRKMAFTWPDVRFFLIGIRRNCNVVPMTADMHELAVAYAERHQLHIYDATIIAAAVMAGCTTLYSEDMHDGLVIAGLTIENPYRA